MKPRLLMRAYTHRDDKTDVRTLRRLDRAKTSVVRVVHVADLKSRPVTGKTARTERGETTLVCHLGKRVGLVHELGQLAGPEERIDDGRKRLRVDEVGRSELLAVPDVHPLADRAGHP